MSLAYSLIEVRIPPFLVSGIFDVVRGGKKGKGGELRIKEERCGTKMLVRARLR